MIIVHAGNKSNVCLPICLSAYLAVCLFVCLSVLSVCLSVSLSVSLFFSHSLSIDIYDFFPTARAAFIGTLPNLQYRVNMILRGPKEWMTNDIVHEDTFERIMLRQIYLQYCMNMILCSPEE